MPQLIQGRERDLGEGFQVRRVLPSAQRRSVGPYVFLDHFGPVTLGAGVAMDVRPHPHIGLATVTYLFEGALMHRDSLGSVQRITPGAINWMTAGRGIVHSERTPEDLRATPHRMHGLQLWVGLPKHMEECAPQFSHMPAEQLPAFDLDRAAARVLIGTAWGRSSPVAAASETVFFHLRLAPDRDLDLPHPASECAVYAIDQELWVDGTRVPAQTLAVLDSAPRHCLRTRAAAQVAIVGGEQLDGPRHLWWNFVSSSTERIQAAAEAWKAQRLGTVRGDSTFIPLPDLPPPR
jgi:redox-sensitive bicupin YhaK (pirin superfamily)